MRKFTYVLGCSLLALASAASAADKPVSVKQFPPLLPKMQLAQSPMNAPLNQNVTKGLECYASTSSYDYNHEPGIIKFYSGSPYLFDKIGKCIDYNPNEQGQSFSGMELTRFIGGSYVTTSTVGGEYMGYLVEVYSFVDYVRAFGAWNLETGEFTVYKDMVDLRDDFYWVDAMSTDPINDKLIGMARSRNIPEDAEAVFSCVGEVDPMTGEFTPIRDLDWYYFAIAFDMDGRLWAYRWIYDSATGQPTGSRLVQLDPNNDYKEISTVKVKKEGSDFPAYYSSTLSFDYTTGDLYAMLCNIDGNQYFCKLNTKTGEMENPSYSYNICTGLYIPFRTADTREAAAKVENLTSTLSDNGNKVTLSWTNPSKAWNGEALTQLEQVLIYRDKMSKGPVATLDAANKVGEKMEWTDEELPAGVHKYIVVPCRVAGEKGVSESWEVFGGEDYPGAPLNVTLVKDGDALKLSWAAPKAGASDGWYDESTLTYKVTRFPDNVVVAEGITETTYTDNSLAEIHSYYYEVEPSTAHGAGTVAASNAIMAGNAYKPNYTADFSTAATALDWTSIDANNDGQKFTYEDYHKGFLISTGTRSNFNDYMISPAMELEAGVTYKVTYDVEFRWRYDEENIDMMHNFDITAGTAPTAAAQNIVLRHYKEFTNLVYNTTHTFTAYFTPTTSGNYNFGYHIFTEAVGDELVFKGAKIERMYDNDLAVESLEGNTEAVEGSYVKCRVGVFNEGNSDASNFTVKVCRLDGDNMVTLGENTITETVPAHTKKYVYVQAKMDVNGTADMVAAIDYAADEYADNNVSKPLAFNIQAAGAVQLNTTVLSKEFDSNTETPEFDLKIDTRVPISSTKIYSNYEAIYLPSDIQADLSGVESVDIWSLAFEYSDNEGGVLQNLPVKVYLGQSSNKSNYDTFNWGSVSGTDLTPLEDMQLVFDGTVTTTTGTNNKLLIPFTEKFTYNPSNNLIVTVVKEGDAGEFSNGNQYPVLFNSFNVCDYNDYDNPVYRSVLYESNKKACDYVSDINYGGRIYVPVLYLAIESSKVSDGIKTIQVGDTFGYDAQNGSISLNGFDASSITVYSLSGQTVKSVGKNNNKGLNLARGSYLVKAVSAEGKVVTTKILVK